MNRVTDWLETRVPAPPPKLAARLRELTAEYQFEDEKDLIRQLIAISEDLLKKIGNDRAAANDLLAADALITYAMESAAGMCDDIESIAAEASLRIATLASSGGTV